MGDPSAWACERRGGGLPVAFHVGATGFGVGAGCGVGVGFGAPLNVGAHLQLWHRVRNGC